MGVGVEVADGQRLHVREHAVTDVLEGALGDCNHDAVVEIGCDQTGRVQAGHAGQSVKQVGKDRRVHEQKGLDAVVNERLEEDRSADRDGCADDDGQNDHDKAQDVALDDHGEQALCRFLGCLRVRSTHFRVHLVEIRHLPRLPSAAMQRLPDKSGWF